MQEASSLATRDAIVSVSPTKVHYPVPVIQQSLETVWPGPLANVATQVTTSPTPTGPGPPIQSSTEQVANPPDPDDNHTHNPGAQNAEKNVLYWIWMSWVQPPSHRIQLRDLLVTVMNIAVILTTQEPRMRKRSFLYRMSWVLILSARILQQPLSHRIQLGVMNTAVILILSVLYQVVNIKLIELVVIVASCTLH